MDENSGIGDKTGTFKDDDHQEEDELNVEEETTDSEVRFRVGGLRGPSRLRGRDATGSELWD